MSKADREKIRYHANLNFLEAFNDLKEKLESLIMATPTGAERDLQTDLQIYLGDWMTRRLDLDPDR